MPGCETDRQGILSRAAGPGRAGRAGRSELEKQAARVACAWSGRSPAAERLRRLGGGRPGKEAVAAGASSPGALGGGRPVNVRGGTVRAASGAVAARLR